MPCVGDSDVHPDLEKMSPDSRLKGKKRIIVCLRSCLMLLTGQEEWVSVKSKTFVAFLSHNLSILSLMFNFYVRRPIDFHV